MATTHLLMSIGIAAICLRYLPAGLPVAGVLVAVAVGGLLPDLDLVAEHRKTLHFPWLAPLAALGMAVLAGATGSNATWLVALGIASAGLHAQTDVLAGSPEPEPWNPTNERAVYNHCLGHWHRPRRYVRYSGAPEDWLCGGVFAVLAIAAPATTPLTDDLVLALVAIAGCYVLVRRRIGAVAIAIVSTLPTSLRRILPRVTVGKRESGASTLRLRFGD